MSTVPLSYSTIMIQRATIMIQKGKPEESNNAFRRRFQKFPLIETIYHDRYQQSSSTIEMEKDECNFLRPMKFMHVRQSVLNTKKDKNKRTLKVYMLRTIFEYKNKYFHMSKGTSIHIQPVNKPNILLHNSSPNSTSTCFYFSIMEREEN